MILCGSNHFSLWGKRRANEAPDGELGNQFPILFGCEFPDALEIS
jgi:hypothetical protein